MNTITSVLATAQGMAYGQEGNMDRAARSQTGATAQPGNPIAPAAATAGSARDVPAPQGETLRQALARANGLSAGLASDLRFSIDDSTNMLVVKVVDGETGEVVRQTPTKEILAIARSLESRRGFLVDAMA